MNQLGFNLIGLIAQIINFVVLLFILNKFVFKTIISFIDKQKNISKETEQWRLKYEEEKENLQKEKNKIIREGEEEAENIVKQAQKEAGSQKEEIIKKAKIEAKEIIDNAIDEIKNREIKMKKEVNEAAANLAVKIASRLLTEFLDKTKQRLLVKKSIASLKKLNF